MTSVFLDTHILIEALQGKGAIDPTGTSIASVTAAEFLSLQGPRATEPAYTLPVLTRQNLGAFELSGRKLNHPFSRLHMDSLILDFGSDHPAIVEFGSLAIAQAINLRAIRTYQQAIAHLDKPKRKAIRAKLDFLIEHHITCVPLTTESAGRGLDWLAAFQESEVPKAKFRNTLNDMLIAAVAERAAARLETRDLVLARHVARQSSARLTSHPGGVSIHFEGAAPRERKDASESKRYVNRGWSVRFGQNRANGSFRAC